jgi:hypothetical protein
LQHESHEHYVAFSPEERAQYRNPLHRKDPLLMTIFWLILETSPSAGLFLKVNNSPPTKYFRAIVRSQRGEIRTLYPEHSDRKKICKYLIRRLGLSSSKLHVLPGSDSAELRKELCKRNRDQLTEQMRYKFGVLYCKKGDVQACTNPDPDDCPDCRNEFNFFDSPLYRNQYGSADFNEFIDWLGNRVSVQSLKEHNEHEANAKIYIGGLDHVTGDTVIANHRWFDQDIPIVFHVSTLLPFHNKPRNQQLERKAHIGNDIVVIIFTEDDTPVDPRVFISQFNHVFFVISKVGQTTSGVPLYRLAIAAKETVPAFTPALSDPAIYPATPEFRYFLHAKLINAERAVYLREENFRRRTAKLDAGLILQWALRFSAYGKDS